LFGQTIPGISIEILTWSVLVRSAGTVARAAPIAAVPAERAPTDGSPQSERAVLDCEGNYNSVAVYPRQALARGVRLRGPAVVTEAQTTTVVPSGCDLTLDESGFLILTLV
jgi:N-methylhydantoinase A